MTEKIDKIDYIKTDNIPMRNDTINKVKNELLRKI